MLGLERCHTLHVSLFLNPCFQLLHLGFDGRHTVFHLSFNRFLLRPQLHVGRYYIIYVYSHSVTY